MISLNRTAILLSLLSPLSFIAPVIAQTATCKQEKVYSALAANTDVGSDSFCQELLAKVSLIGTLRQDPTYFYYETFTDTKSTDIVYKYKATTTKEVVVSTSYESQKRTPLSFTRPLPSYVQQYPTPKVSKACSCLIGTGYTYTQYRVCEPLTTTTTYSTTFTYTVGKPGPSTSTYTDTITKTRLKHTTAPYPSLCPDADNIDYVASDRSAWERGCKTYLNSYRLLDTVKAPNFVACIEKCVDYNNALGYKQCQAVSYLPQSNDCTRMNEPGYFAHNANGNANVATMRFLPPDGVTTDYCATVSGAIRY